MRRIFYFIIESLSNAPLKFKNEKNQLIIFISNMFINNYSKYRFISNSSRYIKGTNRLLYSFKEEVKKIDSVIEHCDIYDKIKKSVSVTELNKAKLSEIRELLRENTNLKKRINELRNENRELKQFLLERFH